MRKILLLLFALCAITAMAQEREYRPFCEEGKVWVVGMFWSFYPIETSDLEEIVTFRMASDTIIENRTCKKISMDTDNGQEYVGACFEEGKKVFMIKPKHQDALMIYDFETEPGKTISVFSKMFSYSPSIVIVEDKEWEDHPERHQRLVNFEMNENIAQYLKPEYYEALCEQWGPMTWEEFMDFYVNAGIWYEGVGSCYGPLQSTLDRSVIYENLIPELLACWTPNEMIYDPQGLAAVHFATVPATTTSPTYDLSGRKMASPHAHGIYIEGGKKVVR